MEKIILSYPELQSNNSRLNKIFFWLITVDILFLPYLPGIAVSASTVIVALWMMLNFRTVLTDKEQKIFFFMTVFMFVGTVANIMYSGDVRFVTTIGTAIKRFFQYIICFGSYFFYKDFFEKNKVDLKKIIFWAVVFIAIFAILYRLFPNEYAMLKIKYNPADNHTRRFLANMIDYRFNYLWTDPNNISYLIAGICGWYLLEKDELFSKKFIVLVASIFIAFCTVSNGGIIMLLIMLFMVITYLVWKAFKNGVRPGTLIGVVIVLTVLFVLLRYTNLRNIIGTNYLSLFSDRLGYYMRNTSMSGGRLEDLKISLKYLNPIMLFFGTGNEGFSYEIGHIYWIGLYGVPAYLMLLYIMFRKTKNQTILQYIWILPFFVAFTMNIAIGEYKWMAIYLMLLAYSRTNKRNINEYCQENIYG